MTLTGFFPKVVDKDCSESDCECVSLCIEVKMREKNLPLPLPLLEQMAATKQNPRFHAEGSVLVHTEMVVEKYFELRDQFDLDDSERKILYWAAVLHDTGKTITTFQDGERWRSPGHEKASLPIARNILFQQEDITADERKRILDIVRWHGFPLQWVKKSQDINDLKKLGTRTDLRLLGIFTVFDFHGRISESQSETLQRIRDFQAKTVPQVEYEMGSFQELQKHYQGWNLRHKNAAWKALQLNQPKLIERLLKAEPPKDYKHFGKKVFLTIGPPLAGKTHFLTQEHSDTFQIQLGDFGIHEGLHSDEYLLSRKLTEFKHLLVVYLNRHRTVAIEGSNLNQHVRLRLAEMIRALEVELEYLVFDSSLDQILSRNASLTSPHGEEDLRSRFKEFDLVHPWEAHQVAYLQP